MNINIKILETLRNEREIREYFLSKNVNITNEEIYKLKESYNQTTNLSNNELTNEQLDGVAGGILYIFDGKVYSTLRDEFPKHMPERVREAAQGLMSTHLDIYINEIKSAASTAQSKNLTAHFSEVATIPIVLEIFKPDAEIDDYSFIFRRVGCDSYGETDLYSHARELELTVSPGWYTGLRLRTDFRYDPSSPEFFEAWQISAAKASRECEALNKQAFPRIYFSSPYTPVFIHKLYRSGKFDCLTCEDIQELSLDMSAADTAGYTGSLYWRLSEKRIPISEYLEHIPHDDVETVTERYRALSSEHHDLIDEEKPYKPISVVVEAPEKRYFSEFSFSERARFFP